MQVFYFYYETCITFIITLDISPRSATFDRIDNIYDRLCGDAVRIDFITVAAKRYFEKLELVMFTKTLLSLWNPNTYHLHHIDPASDTTPASTDKFKCLNLYI